jgi:RimJ/RimL family protein N-acetyltransferase
MNNHDPHAFDTARLRLRPLGEGDEALYCRLYTDPEVMRYIATPMTPDAAQRSFRAALRQQSKERQRWILRPLEGEDGLGLLGLFMEGDTAEMGVMLLPEWEGAGLGSESMAAMVDRAFSSYALRLLWIRQQRDHARVDRMMASIGFVASPSDRITPEQRYWELDRHRWETRRATQMEDPTAGGGVT